MQNSILVIHQTCELTSENSLFDAQGVNGNIPANSTANVDFLLSDDVYITGANFQTNGATFGDTANLQVIDTNGIFSGVAGTVLNQFVTNWVVGTDISGANTLLLEVPYPAKLLATMTLRLVYTNTGSNPTKVGINYLLHKCKY